MWQLQEMTRGMCGQIADVVLYRQSADVAGAHWAGAMTWQVTMFDDWVGC